MLGLLAIDKATNASKKLSGMGMPKGPTMAPPPASNAQVVAMQRKLNGVQAPQALAMEKSAARASALPEYQRMREQASQRANAEQQQQSGALSRRFAAGGALNSGAAIKAQMLAQQQGAEQRANALQGVDVAEQQAIDDRFRQDQGAIDNRNFSRETGNRDAAVQDAQWRIGAGSQLAGMGMQHDQFRRNLALQQEESAFNRLMAQHQLRNSGGLLGGGGFLGTGIQA